jgi:hypothetical protein
MSFADEPVEYAGRAFECGWSQRPQAAGEIAERVQQLARRLAEVDPAYGRIRPDPGMRRLRPSDPGAIVDMPIEDLADRIDRRGRFDPPRFPAPVGPTGYNVLYRGDELGASFLAVSIRAGQYGSGWVENRVRVRPEVEHPLWRDPEQGIRVMDAMVQIWSPEWACAFSHTASIGPDNVGISTIRPWLAWTLQPLQPRPNPPYGRPYPAPFPLDDAGAPAEVRPWHGGELQIWP